MLWASDGAQRVNLRLIKRNYIIQILIEFLV